MIKKDSSLKWLTALTVASALTVAGCFLNNSGADTDTKRPALLDTSKLGDPLPRNLWIELSKAVNPAVVSITTAARVRTQYRDPMQEFFDQFYGNQSPGMRGNPPGGREQMMALGTGFIIRDDGLIITNNHVVESADIIKVQLDASDSKLYEATVIGRDARTDLALIKIDAKKKLPFVQLGSSKDVQVGEWVAAFGNPYGHAHTMTVGIVSALGREIAEINRFPFIQTDASINPGNSGGPLVNSQGYVIGVNSAIDARAQGIGFAIPIDNVKQIVEQLERDGRIRRGFLGVGIATVDEEIASQLGMPDEPRGVLITQILRGGPADRAGVKPYDVITEFNSKTTNTAGELQNLVADTKIGTSVPVRIWRFDDQGKRKELRLDLRVEENPEDSRKTAVPMKQYAGQKAPFDFGFKVNDWNASLAKQLGLPEDTPHGPMITEMTPGTPGSRAGLQIGDVFLDVNRQSVTRATDVLKLLKKGRNFVRVARGGDAVLILTLGQ